eukprot:5203585-Lingulodinium_polyedra.AAC.1
MHRVAHSIRNADRLVLADLDRPIGAKRRRIPACREEARAKRQPPPLGSRTRRVLAVVDLPASPYG